MAYPTNSGGELMKKSFASLLSILLIITLLVACGGKKNVVYVGADKPTDDVDPKTDETKEYDGKILLFVSGNLGDLSFADLSKIAVDQFAAENNLELTVIEGGKDSSKYVKTFLDAIETGNYDYSVSPSWYIFDDLLENAKKYPNTKFVVFDTERNADEKMTDIDNLIGISYKQNEGSFLGGIYSCLMTKKNYVACIGNSDSPIINDFIAGYVHGIKWFNDEKGTNVKYQVTYNSQEATVQDTYNTTDVLYNTGVDVLYNIAGSRTLGACKAAEDKGGIDVGYYVIGVDYDQWQVFTEIKDVPTLGKDNIATSVIKNITPTVLWGLNGFKNGNVEPGNHLLGVELGAVGLAKNQRYFEVTPKEVQDEIDRIERLIADGDLKVLSYFEEFGADSDKWAAYRDKPNARL
jgi:basic membrane protein A